MKRNSVISLKHARILFPGVKLPAKKFFEVLASVDISHDDIPEHGCPLLKNIGYKLETEDWYQNEYYARPISEWMDELEEEIEVPQECIGETFEQFVIGCYGSIENALVEVLKLELYKEAPFIYVEFS